jgi:hypothetical protein
MRFPTIVVAVAVAAVAGILPSALPATTGPVAALRLGDTISGTVEAGTLEAVPFDATAGTLLDIDLRMAPASGPGLSVMQPDRTPLLGIGAYAKLDAKSSYLKVRKAPLEQSGRHYLLLQPTVPGAYKLTVKGKPLTKGLFEGFVSGEPPTEVNIGAVPGTLLSITVKAARGSGLAPKVIFVRGPQGADVALGTAASHVLGATSDLYKNLPLPDLGQYSIGIGTVTGLYGDYGVVQISVKLPKTKKAGVNDGDLVVNPFVDRIQPSQGFDNLPYSGVAVSGEFFRPGASLDLEGPAVITPTSLTRQDDENLVFDVDLAGSPTGIYDLVVSYANGAVGRLPAAFRVMPTPIPTAISPTLGFDNSTQPFTVTGTRFQANVAVAIRPTAGGSAVQGTVTSSTATQAVLTFPLLDVPLGSWDVVVTNPDGGTRTLAGALTVQHGPRFTAAAPLLGHDNESARAVTLTGNYFQAGMSCTLDRTGQTTIPSVITGLTATAATATFDLRNKAAGSWNLRVTNTDGSTAALASPFVITRAPRPGALAGGRYFDGIPVTGESLAGTDFVSGAQVTFEVGGTPTLSATNEAVNMAGTQVTFDVNATGLQTGDHDLRMTNPDGGTALVGAAAKVLGLRTLTSNGVSAGRPSIAYNPIDNEYLAVYSVFDGSQRDVRGQRFSAVSGKPLGNEIPITSGTLDSSTTEDQTAPCVVFSAVNDASFAGGIQYLYFVAYAWSDPNASPNKVKILSQLLNRDGSLNGDQTVAFPELSAASGAVDSPRVAWNSTRQEWMVVFGYDTSTIPDVCYACLGTGYLQGDGVTRTPSSVGAGTLFVNTHSVTVTPPSGPPVTFNQHDKDYEPDVAWSATRNEYIVSYTFDVVEAGNPPPADTGTDVRAKVYGGNFSAGPVQQADLTTLGDVASKNERRSRVATNGGATYLVAWDYAGAAGNRDVRCWLVNATTRAKIGATVTTVEQTAANDAASVAVAWDGSGAGSEYLLAYLLNPGVSGTSSMALARIPLGAGPVLGTPTYGAPAAALANAAFDAGDVAARAVGNEILVGWTVTGSAKSPADAEVRFTK